MSGLPEFSKLETRLLRHREALGLRVVHVVFLSLVRGLDYSGKGYSYRGHETTRSCWASASARWRGGRTTSPSAG